MRKSNVDEIGLSCCRSINNILGNVQIKFEYLKKLNCNSFRLLQDQWYDDKHYHSHYKTI